MTNKIFSVATFILVAWLAVTLTTTSRQLTLTEQMLSNTIEVAYTNLADRIESLETTRQTADQVVLSQLEQLPSQQEKVRHPDIDTTVLTELKEETSRLKAQLASETYLKELKTAYKHVIETEFEKDNDALSAADKLLATKEAIWKTSMQHEEVRDSLRGLMGPIDSLASKWKRGDTENTVKPVFNVLQQTIATLDVQ